jgi:CobQ/CobB/MinD/ParA nucleotide binding domain
LLLAADVKCLSALRRMPAGRAMRVSEQFGREGDVCAFVLLTAAAPLSAEAVTGRAMTLAPGDTFLGTPGHRESTRWVVGRVPDGGLVPGDEYWLLADGGAVGAFLGDSPREKSHLGRVTFRGVVLDADGTVLNMRHFAVAPGPGQADDRGVPVFLVVGTSSEVGKTTAAVSVLRALRRSGRQRVAALKATGTSSLTELHSYQDFGAAPCFDCVDFGLPTTYPSGRPDIGPVFETMLDTCLSAEVDAVLVECGGDILGANVPVFLDGVARRRPEAKVILVASDSLAALGAKTVLAEMGLAITLIAGPCTDTPTIQRRTQELCGVPALNLARGAPVALF